MSLADELSGALGGGRKRRGGGRRQQYLSDDEDDDVMGQYGAGNGELDDLGDGAPLGQAHGAELSGGGSLGAELADLAGSSRRSKRSTAKSSVATTGHAAPAAGAADDLDGLIDEDADAMDGASAKARGGSGGATYVQEADPLWDPYNHIGPAEAELEALTQKTCAALSDTIATTDAFLQRLRKLTTTDASQSSSLPASSTVTANLSSVGSSSSKLQIGTVEDTARLEAYAASLLRGLRETATQREQEVRDLREVDRHMARGEATDPEFLAKLAEADERLDAEADEAEAAAEGGDAADESTDTAAEPKTQTWAEAQRNRRRQDSTASAETEKAGPTAAAPLRISSEPFTSEVTDTLAGLLQRSVIDIDVEEGGDGLGPHGGSDDEDEMDNSYAAGNRTEELDDAAGEDELGPGWDDPTYRGSRRGAARTGREASSGAVGDVSLNSVTSAAAGKTPPTLPSLRTSSTLLAHSLSSLHETAQVHRATISAAERRLRALRLLLDGWKDEIVAERRSRAWVARWEGREPDADDLLLDDGSGKVDDVLAASLAKIASTGSGTGASVGSRYTGGSGITPKAFADEHMERFRRLLGEAEEKAKVLLTPLPLPRVGPAAA